MASKIVDHGAGLTPDEVYRMAGASRDFFEEIRANTRLSTGGNVAGKVDGLKQQMRTLEEIFTHTSQSHDDRRAFEHDIGQHQTAINHLEAIARQAMVEVCLSGELLGLGYRDGVQVEVIPPASWAFFDDMDLKAGTAGPYRAIRFIGRGMASAEDWRAFLAESSKHSGEAPLPEIAPAGLPAAKEDRSSEKTERELNRWLRETWEAEGRRGGSEFFIALKRYKNQKGSPIEDWYSAGKDAGVKWRTSTGASGECSRKTIQNKVSEFKRHDQK